MSDEELVQFLGIADMPTTDIARFIAAMPPERRELYERMAHVEIELALWQAGVGPMPAGVIVCKDHSKWHR